MEKDIFNRIKNKKIKLITGIILILISLIIEVKGFNFMKKELKDPISLIDVRNEKEYSYIDVSLMTDYFATYGNDEGKSKFIYFVWDEKYMYVTNLTKDNLEKLKDIMAYSYKEIDNKPKQVRIYGYSKEIENDLKRIIIKSYNEMYEEEFLNNENIDNYLGIYYLDTSYTPDDDFLLFSVLASFLLISGVVLIVKYFKNKKRMNKFLEEFALDIDKIKNEIELKDTLYNKKAKIYITNNYIISLVNGFEIYKINDIRWLYPHENRYNGAITDKSIFIVTNDSKIHMISKLSSSKKNLIKFDEIYELIVMKTPNSMHGYTNENIEKNRELSKK